MNPRVPADAAGEVAGKIAAVCSFLAAHDLDAILLRRRGPVGWLLGGSETHVRLDTEDGVAIVGVDRRGELLLVTSVIEAARLADEELGQLPITAESSPWTTNLADVAVEAMRRKGWPAERVAGESALGAARSLRTAAAEAFRALRYSFGAAELARYRELCHACALDLEAVTANLRPGMTEHEAAAALSAAVIERGCRPTVVLVAFDERIERYRHPVPTSKLLQRRAMLVLCAERGGQVMAATRFAGLAPLDAELERRFAAVTAVDAAAIAATRPGARVKDVFAQIVAAYAEHGFADEWLLHHQGGSIGYAGREYKGSFDAPQVVCANQPFAWNPSITGTKCEDTVLATAGGSEILTATGQWPTVDTSAGPRPIELLLGG